MGHTIFLPFPSRIYHLSPGSGKFYARLVEKGLKNGAGYGMIRKTIPRGCVVIRYRGVLRGAQRDM